MTEIDKLVEKGAYDIMDDAPRWMQSWRDANKAYSEMKQVESNALFKLVTRKGMTPKLIARGLSRYITATDGTFHEVVSKLPKGTRTKVEGEVFSTLVDKFTTGGIGDMRATHFPMLADELKRIPFTTKEARALRDAVVKMGEVFKNDIQLGSASGQLQIPRFQSYLTTDPVVRAKFEIASGIFNRIKQMVPGEQQQDLALVNVLTKLLDDPMNKQVIQELTETAGHRIDISDQLLTLQREMAKRAASGADEGATRVKIYGNDRIASVKPTQAAQEATDSIPVHRIATREQYEQIAKANGVDPSDVKRMDELLDLEGFLAVQYGSTKIRRVSK